MSADVHDLTGDKTMNANKNVKLANDDLWPVRSTGGTRALTEGNGPGETYRRPHAPRSDKPKNAVLTGPHFAINSTSELRSSATRRLRVSEGAPPSLRVLDRIQASYRLRIGYSPADRVSQIRRLVWSRGRTAHPRHPLPASSVDSYSRRQLAAYCRPNPPNCGQRPALIARKRSRSEVQFPRAVHGFDFTTLQLAPTTTRVPKQLTRSETTAAVIKSAAINPE